MIKPRRKTSKPLPRDEAPLRGQPRRPRNPQQPNRQFDPMPSRIEPCLALLKDRAPVGPEWLYKIKWDGYRFGASCAKCEREAWLDRWEMQRKGCKNTFLGSLTARLRCRGCNNRNGNRWMVGLEPR